MQNSIALPRQPQQKQNAYISYKAALLRVIHKEQSKFLLMGEYRKRSNWAGLVDDCVLLRLHHFVVLILVAITVPGHLCWDWGILLFISSRSSSNSRLIFCSHVRTVFDYLTSRIT